MIDRSEVNRALAKTIAYKNCGKQNQANEWAAELVRILECADILRDAEQIIYPALAPGMIPRRQEPLSAADKAKLNDYLSSRA
jgi:hypothetical protein